VEEWRAISRVLKSPGRAAWAVFDDLVTTFFPGDCRACGGPLLKTGVKIYEYEPTMYHCKMMIVDDVWVSVGSANFGNRSFRLNDEANLNIHDREFALRQIADDTQTKLPQVVGATDALRPVLGIAQCGQEHRSQHANHADHNK